MVAIFDVQYDNEGADGAPTATSVVGNLRFRADDTNDQDLNFPLIIPDTGTIFSFWKNIYLLCTSPPDSLVDNVVIFSDGVLGWDAGVTVQVANDVLVKNSGSDAGYEVATGQDEMITDHSGVTAKTQLFDFTTGTPRPVTISESGLVIDLAGESTDYVLLQTDVEDTALPGTKPQEDITWQYDEI